MGIFAGLNADESLIIKRLAFFICLLSVGISQGQSNDIGFFIGKGFAFTDVGAYWKGTESDNALGGFYRRNFNPHWAVRGNFQIGQISAADSLSKESFKVNRNLSFRNQIVDGNLIVEFNFWNYSHHKRDNQHTPYIFGGIGYSLTNPQAFYQGEWVDLRPLNTEGQGSDLYDRKPYKRGQFNIPMGIGYKVMLGSFSSIGLEASFRKTFTDYLDDVSTTYPEAEALNSSTAAALSDRSLDGENHENFKRGNPMNNDWYAFIGATVIIQFRRSSQRCAQF